MLVGFLTHSIHMSLKNKNYIYYHPKVFKWICAISTACSLIATGEMALRFYLKSIISSFKYIDIQKGQFTPISKICQYRIRILIIKKVKEHILAVTQLKKKVHQIKHIYLHTLRPIG